MKKSLLLFVLFLHIGIFPANADAYRIEATIKDVKSGTLFFLKQFDNQRIINSVRLEKGKLIMSDTLADTPQHLWLCTTLND
ncbi:MAG: hypothetical protein LUD02_14520 [Tannerellaceae bacterium]|nr:hypothetical protein [Tannerellaceae bacterium]